MRYLIAALTVLFLAGCGGGTLPELPETELDASLATLSYSGPSGRAKARAFSAIVVNTKNGRILYQEKSGELRYPASLTKMMTLYLLFDEIKAGRLSMSDELQVSKKAASQPPAKIGLKEGVPITVRQAVQAMAVMF